MCDKQLGVRVVVQWHSQSVRAIFCNKQFQYSSDSHYSRLVVSPIIARLTSEHQ